MATGRPVLGLVNPNSETAAIIRKTNCGVVADPRDRMSVLKVITELKENKRLREKLGENGRKEALLRYSRDVVLGKYEEFFGEIRDEYDEELHLYRCVEPRQMEVNAKVPIEELNQRFDLDLPVGEYQTLGGFLMHQLGHIPKRGEKVETVVCTLVILSASRKKVSWVRIVRKDNEAPISLE